MRKLTDEQVMQLSMLRGLGYQQREIADKLGITPPAVGFRLRVLHGRAEKDGPEKVYKEILLKGQIEQMERISEEFTRYCYETYQEAMDKIERRLEEILMLEVSK